MPTPVRRVVTGHDATGKSVVRSDGVPPQNHALVFRMRDFPQACNERPFDKPIAQGSEH